MRIVPARGIAGAVVVLSRPAREIERICRRFKIRARPWTDKERELLEFYFARYDVARVGWLLERSPEEVAAEAERLNLFSSDEREEWRDYEDDVIHRYWKKESAVKIAERLGRTADSVRGRARILGLVESLNPMRYGTAKPGVLNWLGSRMVR